MKHQKADLNWRKKAHEERMGIEHHKIHVRKEEIAGTAKTQDRQTLIYAQQLALLEQQTAIQAKQTEILDRTYGIYRVMAIIAAVGLLIGLLNVVLLYLSFRK